MKDKRGPVFSFCPEAHKNCVAGPVREVREGQVIYDLIGSLF